MSIMFGRWNFEGEPPESQYVDKVRSALALYSPDDHHVYSSGGVSILYDAFHTTRQSRLEYQPFVTRTGCVVTWDGRLDNREQLIAQLNDSLSTESADVSIVAAAYDRWETQCFEKLVGDWALSVWNPTNRCLTLAKDPIGPRHLYYTFDKKQITWSTVLEPLILFAGKAFTLNKEYIAGWFSFFPAAHLTPYVGIHSVPPSSFVRVEAQEQTIQNYWNFDGKKRILYRTDAEYEEHFRAVFSESVRRRARSDVPILAELSGGMDSSSIVCMADTLKAQGLSDVPRIDTVSYYDDSEPNWNERPYFAKVEDKRGRVGRHINANARITILPEYEDGRFAATPGSGAKPDAMHLEFARHLKSEGNRVVLSGLGGDEVLGGVPTPIPELADLFARGNAGEFGKQIVRWALATRKPLLYLFAETLRSFLPVGILPQPRHKRHPEWLYPSFAKQNRVALSGYDTRLNLFGPLPTFQENLETLEVLRRQLACSTLHFDPPLERRYPYLDRDLLEFIYAVPREQLVRPGQRRSLMRRALAGIVPDEVLNRKRKALVTRSPVIAISSEWDLLVRMTDHMVSDSLGIVDSKLFREALKKARLTSGEQIVPLMRTVAVEMWLKNIVRWAPQLTGGSITNGRREEYLAGKSSLFPKQAFFSAENYFNKERG
jgi:asparagine synthase (glutamine-hydrolysing)